MRKLLFKFAVIFACSFWSKAQDLPFGLEKLRHYVATNSIMQLVQVVQIDPFTEEETFFEWIQYYLSFDNWKGLSDHIKERIRVREKDFTEPRFDPNVEVTIYVATIINPRHSPPNYGLSSFHFTNAVLGDDGIYRFPPGFVEGILDNARFGYWIVMPIQKPVKSAEITVVYRSTGLVKSQDTSIQSVGDMIQVNSVYQLSVHRSLVMADPDHKMTLVAHYTDGTKDTRDENGYKPMPILSIEKPEFNTISLILTGGEP